MDLSHKNLRDKDEDVKKGQKILRDGKKTQNFLRDGEKTQNFLEKTVFFVIQKKIFSKKVEIYNSQN